ncbi:MAG: (Fe-S)-binding protein [candidate division Zixibacteria bacterium]|nr:(Fe-S)-binding protein [candidate division Zixibacteria bacterium]
MKEEIIRKTKAYYCLDCGKCTAVCPISNVRNGYSPRKLVTLTVNRSDDYVLQEAGLWFCLTCRMCQDICPSDVDYVELTKLLRGEAKKAGEEGRCSHGGALQSIMKIMTAPDLKQDRMGWISSDLKTSNDSEYLYFVGCLPYFDTFFSDIKANSLDIARSTLKILNLSGVEPQVIANERCCGHDLLWTGDFENFKRLAQHNVNEIKKTGAKKIITSCPECLMTLKVDYPDLLGKVDYEVMHISEFLSDKLSQIKIKGLEKKVTFQDPCRLGRFMNIYEAPRKVMKSIKGVEFREMKRSGAKAICCGTAGWINCDAFSKKIQDERLKEAKSTGAEILVTACPKCQIHFKCAQSEYGKEKSKDELKIDIIDLTTLLALAIGGE